jgi:hypothetical protein
LSVVPKAPAPTFAIATSAYGALYEAVADAHQEFLEGVIATREVDQMEKEKMTGHVIAAAAPSIASSVNRSSVDSLSLNASA